MIQKDLNRLNMWKVVSKVLEEHEAIWRNNIPFGKAVANLRALIAAADKILEGQIGTTKGISQDKKARKDYAITKVLAIASSSKAYALSIANNTLYDAVNFSRNTLLHLPQNALPARLRGMLEAAEEFEMVLRDYGVGADSFTDAEAAIVAFEAMIPSVRIAMVARKTLSQSIPQTMKAGKTQLMILDGIVHIFEEAAPHFVDTFRGARSIVDAGIRHDK